MAGGGGAFPGRGIADLLVVDGDSLADPAVLRKRDQIWLVLQLGEPVAGVALETGVVRLSTGPSNRPSDLARHFVSCEPPRSRHRAR